ncbi:MAG: EF-P lysine aminoacylase GenX [Gammaproteobacteria bacterium]|nr:EF-P lysine aminoacylase GenX [Gammaproteobacteria bacterium]
MIDAAEWRPGAARAVLKARAAILATIRTFFDERGIVEVETPCLAAAPATDPHIQSLRVATTLGSRTQTLYLQSSPEFAMKRLLAAGCGPIYQITRAFRDGEVGRYHNVEFTILEWYRPGFDHRRLMAETASLLVELTGLCHWRARRYADVFRAYAGLDFNASRHELVRAALEKTGVAHHALADMRRADLLDLLFAHAVQPNLDGLCMVYDFPACQCALARIYPAPNPVAARFEGFINGVEIANGYHELTDSAEQRARMVDDLAERRRLGLPAVPMDERLLAALAAGLPDTAGVAVGVDRIVQLALNAGSLDDVIAFSSARSCAP